MPVLVSLFLGCDKKLSFKQTEKARITTGKTIRINDIVREYFARSQLVLVEHSGVWNAEGLHTPVLVLQTGKLDWPMPFYE